MGEKMTYRCRCCGCSITFGNSEALIDDDGNYFCDEGCALSYHNIVCVDWEEEEKYEYESNKTRENYYGAYIAKDGFITNDHYAIIGANFSDNIDDGSCYKGIEHLKEETTKMAKEVEAPEFAKLVKLSECKIFDNTDGHIEEQSRDVFIEILGNKYNKNYIDLIVELLGLPDSICVRRKNDNSPLVILCDDESLAIVMHVYWED